MTDYEWKMDPEDDPANYDENGNYIPPSDNEDTVETKDSNGTILADGDAVHLIKDLKVKGSSLNLKRGEVIKNIRLTHDPECIDCKVGKAQIVLRTEFLKKK